ncbi:hypothetical protein [Larkinella humicola]|uniref:Uncharacterized protein n=1 Tax=Larkinella humicola TaxID=2607654 RepID=A0A5N1J5K1_9BACT|nr:hypothetical protein [Larkinella humicola]KAA9341074.1 hypothetical protein F0P93_30780 [Larkinella humicola]
MSEDWADFEPRNWLESAFTLDVIADVRDRSAAAREGTLQAGPLQSVTIWLEFAPGSFPEPATRSRVFRKIPNEKKGSVRFL